jgi:hypothetical protein
MKPPAFLKTPWLLLALVVMTLALGATGCATTESDNTTERPWNTPRGWDTGIPSDMYNRPR